MFSMCSELTPRAPVPDNRIPQLMQPCVCGGGAIWMSGTDGMDGPDGTDGTEGKYEANGEMSRTNELDVLDG